MGELFRKKNMRELDATKVQGPTKINKGMAPAHNPQPKREEKGDRVTKTQKDGLTPLTFGKGRIFLEAHKNNLINLPPQKESPQRTNHPKILFVS